MCVCVCVIGDARLTDAVGSHESERMRDDLPKINGIPRIGKVPI